MNSTPRIAFVLGAVWPTHWPTKSSRVTERLEALGLKVLDANGKLVTVTMGSYGIGVSRAVAAVAEGTSDEKGLCWPRQLAPFDVQVVATGKGEEVFGFAEKLATELDEAGAVVLYDDRKASPGVKFADSEILGMPTTVVVGRGLADGVVETVAWWRAQQQVAA